MMGDFNAKLGSGGKAGRYIGCTALASGTTGMMEWQQWRRQTNCRQYLVHKGSRRADDLDCAEYKKYEIDYVLIEGRLLSALFQRRKRPKHDADNHTYNSCCREEGIECVESVQRAHGE